MRRQDTSGSDADKNDKKIMRNNFKKPPDIESFHPDFIIQIIDQQPRDQKPADHKKNINT